MGLPGFEPGFPTPEAGRIPGYPTNPLSQIRLTYLTLKAAYLKIIKKNVAHCSID